MHRDAREGMLYYSCKIIKQICVISQHRFAYSEGDGFAFSQMFFLYLFYNTPKTGAWRRPWLRNCRGRRAPFLKCISTCQCKGSPLAKWGLIFDNPSFPILSPQNTVCLGLVDLKLPHWQIKCSPIITYIPISLLYNQA